MFDEAAVRFANCGFPNRCIAEAAAEANCIKQTLAEATFAYRASVAETLEEEKYSIQDSMTCFEDSSHVSKRVIEAKLFPAASPRSIEVDFFSFGTQKPFCYLYF